MERNTVRFKRSLAGRSLKLSKAGLSIDMIPMIDIVFQLVLFFLVSTTFAMLPGIALNLPESSSAEAVNAAHLSVTIINRDEVYLNKERTLIDNLAAALTGFRGSGQTETQNVTLEADESVSYRLVIEVLDILRTTGFQHINLQVTVNTQ